MGGLFITSTSSVNRHGAFAIERQPPAVIRATGTGVVGMVGQFPWGPINEVFTPESPKDMINTLAPRGMTRTGSAYLSIIRKAFPTIKFVRIVGASPVKATATVPKSGPTNMLTLTAKYYGSAGNSLSAVVSAASDGDANHFNLTVSVTGASGTTTDIIKNLNYSGTGADSIPDLSACALIGSITKLASGVPTAGTYSFSSGSNGSAVASSDYLGTAGSGDAGLALFEGERTIRHVFSDDPGNSLRAAVNAGLQAHAELMGDRVAYINGNNGLSSSSTLSDAASYRSENVVYCDPWVRILDDVDGTKRDVPPAAFAAAVAAQTSPSTSIAWKGAEIGTMLAGIEELVSSREVAAGTNTDNGIATLIQEEDGSYRFEADPVTINASDPARGSLRRTRMGIYIASSLVQSVRPSVDAPNVPLYQQDVVNATDRFMSTLKRNLNVDPLHNPHVVDYSIPLDGENSASDIANGDFTVPIDVQISPSMARIFFSLNYGETVTVTHQ